MSLYMKVKHLSASPRKWLGISWLEQNQRSAVALLAVVVGIIVGLAAVLLKWLIEFIHILVDSTTAVSTGNWQYLLMPALGILLTALYLRFFVRSDISHGVTRVLYAFSRKKSRIPLRHTYSSLIASSLTIGFGGSVGAEGPIAFTGAAIGSNLGRAFRFEPQMLMLLVGCGAAAGIAGIFKAPIAGVLFVVEVLMLDLTAGRSMPLILASVCGATVSYVFTGNQAEFMFTQSVPFTIRHLPVVALLGVLCGLMSLYFIFVIDRMEVHFKRIRPQARFLLGAALLSLLIFLFPPLYGEGYNAITTLIGNNPADIVEHSYFYSLINSETGIILFVLLLAVFKAVATSATNGAGGVGGTFAPSLFVGCMTGFCFASVMSHTAIYFGAPPLSTGNFALLGMAGVMAGVMHAPLMAIFLAAEMTGGYQLFLPLLLVSAIAYGTSRVFTPYGIYARRLARQGELLSHHKDQSVLTLLRVEDLIETDFNTVTADMSLKEMVNVIAHCHRNLFPVVDSQQHLVGIVRLDDIRDIIFRTDLYHKLTVERFMTEVTDVVQPDTAMEHVMRIFDRTGTWNLPVVDYRNKYLGFISKSKIFTDYRQVLQHYSDD